MTAVQSRDFDTAGGEPGADEEEFRLGSFFPYLVRVYYRAVSDCVRDIYEKNHGLTSSEWRAMAVLNDYEPLSAKEIVNRSSLDKVNVSRAIARLQKRGFLARHIDPTDRRRVLLRLTPKGKKAMAQLVPLVRDVEERILDGLSRDERDTLLALMARVRKNAEAIVPPGDLSD